MSSSEIPRRQFLRHAVIAASAVGVASSARSLAASSSPSHVEHLDNDLERYRKVDPALIKYTRASHFTLTKTDARRLAMSPDGQLYVAAGNAVLVLDAAGNSLGEISTTAPIRAVSIANDASVFVGVKDHVEVFDAKRKRIATWDAQAKALITGIAVGERDVFVADAGNRIVWRYDRSGKLARRVGEKDTARNIPGFVIPSPYFDVEIGADGLLRVSNPGRHRVETYTFDGDLEASWGKPGAGIASFCGCCNPCNIEVLPDGRVVTFEKGLPRVKVFSAQGELQCVVAAPASFADPAKSPDNNLGALDGAIDSKGNVYVLDTIAGDVQVFAPQKSSAS